jgi:hypothetical protein
MGSELVWDNANINNAAGLDRVQSQSLGLGENLFGFRAWVQPELVTALTGNLGQQLFHETRRQVDAYSLWSDRHF